MTRLAVSNIGFALSADDRELRRLADLGVSGLEIAPSRVWSDTWHNLKSADVGRFARRVKEAGLSVVGLHSLFFDHPELGLFRNPEIRSLTIEFLVRLSAVCRDLGGRSLIWGGGRKRGPLPAAEAETEALAFMSELCRRIETHGTSFCFEPLGPKDTDFINSALESLRLVEAVDHPAFSVQLDAKALWANDEVRVEIFRQVGSRLTHFHVNEPDFGILGSSGLIDHRALGRHLKDICYDGYVSLEQRQLSANESMRDVEVSIAVMHEHYR